MTDNGHIKLHRKMLEWEWYKDTNTFCLFLHCLLIANWKDGRFMGVVIPRGSFVSSYPQLAQQTNMSLQNVRTAINHLKSTGELTVKSHAKYSIFTVVNYCQYQDVNMIPNIQLTDNQQTTNRQLTTIEEGKKVRKEEEKNIYINNNIYPSNFDEFWKCYPRKQDKGQAYKCYQARLNDGYTAEQLLTACKNYAAECEKENREKKYIKVGSTFLSANEPFLDYLKGGSGEDGGNSRELAEQAERDKDKYYEEYFKSDRYKNAEMPFV